MSGNRRDDALLNAGGDQPRNERPTQRVDARMGDPGTLDQIPPCSLDVLAPAPAFFGQEYPGLLRGDLAVDDGPFSLETVVGRKKDAYGIGVYGKIGTVEYITPMTHTSS